MLFAISGISGVSGQIEYPVPPFWIVIHEHRFGPHAWLVASGKEPTERQAVQSLRIDFETQSEGAVSIHPVAEIITPDWEEGDHEPLE